MLDALGARREGLASGEARARLDRVGPNALRTHGVRAVAVFLNQLRSPFLLLLLATAVASIFFGERTDALIIFLISGLSVGLGFVSEFRSARAVEALHSRLRHTIDAIRDGKDVAVDVTQLVPGDVVRIGVGDVVPADLRLLETADLECDESVLTGEAAPAVKRVEPVGEPASPIELPPCAFMGTVVCAGNGVGVVVQTGGRTEFGRIAAQLGTRQPQTAFQLGLRDFSLLLVRITVVLAGTILVVNLALGHPAIQSILFALSISIGLTPQLLPAIVTVSLSTGARRLAERKVIVKRLVAIEDFGNIEVFFTDKTGTLTEGRIRFAGAVDVNGTKDGAVLRDGSSATTPCSATDRSSVETRSTRPCGRHLRRTRLTSTHTVASRCDPSTTTGGSGRLSCRDSTVGGRRSSRVPPSSCSRAAATFPPRRSRCSTRNSQAATASSPSAPATPGNRPHSRPTTSTISSSPASSPSSIRRSRTRPMRSHACTTCTSK